MDTNKLANWLQVGANIGILAGLVLVGVQIKESTDIARADITQQSWAMIFQVHLARMGENPSAALAKAQTDPSSLTDEEIEVITAFYYFWHDIDSNMEIMSRQGLFLDDDIDANSYLRERATLYARSPIGRKIWEQMKDRGLQYEWMKIVDAEITRLHEVGWKYNRYDELRNAGVRE